MDSTASSLILEATEPMTWINLHTVVPSVLSNLQHLFQCSMMKSQFLMFKLVAKLDSRNQVAQSLAPSTPCFNDFNSSGLQTCEKNMI